jgi:DNA polymerase theta
MIGRQFIDVQSYRQMCGRAGRKGRDTMGESILFCTEKDKEKVKTLIHSKLEAVISCLSTERNGMKRALLEVLVSRVVRTADDIHRYSLQTLLHAQGSEKEDKTIQDALDFLIKGTFIETMEIDNHVLYLPTKLGEATVASGLGPEEALIVYRELKRALKAIVLEDEVIYWIRYSLVKLHMVYEVTPTFLHIEPNWPKFSRIYDNLSEVQRSIAYFAGVNESFLQKAAMGQVPSDSAQQMQHRRFYSALMLNELIHEKPFKDIMKKYLVSRGTLQTLQTMAATFAGMVTVFCKKLGWRNLEILFHQFQDRLQFGIEGELLELVKIPSLKGYQARALWQSGFRSCEAIVSFLVSLMG